MGGILAFAHHGDLIALLGVVHVQVHQHHQHHHDDDGQQVAVAADGGRQAGRALRAVRAVFSVNAILAVDAVFSVCSVLPIDTVFTVSAVSAVRSGSFYAGVRVTDPPVPVFADGRRQAVRAILAVRTSGLYAGVGITDPPVSILADDGRQTVRAILTVDAVPSVRPFGFHAGVHNADPPVAVRTDGGRPAVPPVLSVLSGGFHTERFPRSPAVVGYLPLVRSRIDAQLRAEWVVHLDKAQRHFARIGTRLKDRRHIIPAEICFPAVELRADIQPHLAAKMLIGSKAPAVKIKPFSLRRGA